MKDLAEPIVTILTAVVGVAIIAVLVSQRANTAGVFSAAGSAFANVLSAATAPVTGNAATPSVQASGGLLSGVSLPSLGGGTGGSYGGLFLNS